MREVMLQYAPTASPRFNQAGRPARVVGIGFEEIMYDILYSSDSATYVLPQDFSSILSIMLRKEGEWSPVFLNLGFMADTNAYNYTLFKANTDTSYLYIKGKVPSYVKIDARHLRGI